MNFDDIRPYNDSEIQAAMQRVAALDLAPQIVRFVYPEADIAVQLKRLADVKTSLELQSTFMNDAIKRIIELTTDGLTHTGLGYLRRRGNYLFLSNHRDITLDAFLLQHLLLEEKGKTSYIVFGDNLLAMPAAADLFRCNKLISMHRGGTPRAFYESLAHLSRYLHLLIEEQQLHEALGHARHVSPGPADVLQGILPLRLAAPAILKMLAMGSDCKQLEALEALNIVPMSISYEWDPCDTMKANELAVSETGEYKKAPGEDLASVVTGIQGHKGRVHLSIGKPLSPEELVPADGEDLFEHVARVVDSRIIHSYKLMPSNYAAYDMLNHRSRFRSRYGAATMLELEHRMATLADEKRRKLLLEMYANPVVSALETR